LQLGQLRVFQVVARSQTFTAAAEILGRSQPAISMQVRALERELGVSLVEVSHRRIRLTVAGEELLRHADRVLAGVDGLDRAMARMRGGGGPVRIGASATPSSYLLPYRLAPFVRQHPDVQIRLSVENPGALHELLDSGAIDVAVAMGAHDLPPWQGDFEIGTLGLDEMRVVLPAGDPRAGRDWSIAELREVPLVLRESESHTRTVLQRALGYEPQPVMELASNEAVKRAVAAGVGVGVLSELSVAWEVDAGRLSSATCADLGGPRRVYSYRRVLQRRLPAEEALWQALHDASRP
jgi:DNA-binding transcriptional LysR family regulator